MNYHGYYSYAHGEITTRNHKPQLSPQHCNHHDKVRKNVILYAMGACFYSLSHYFTLFLAKGGPPKDQFGEARFVNGQFFFTFPPDQEKSGGVGRPPPPDFFSARLTFSTFLYLIIELAQEEPPPP